MNTLEIVTVSSLDYLHQTLLMAKSALHHSDSRLRFWVFHTDIPASARAAVSRSFPKESTIKFVESAGGNRHLHHHFNEVVFAKLQIDRLPRRLAKILYVDSDIVFLDDVSRAFTVELGNCLLAAALDPIVESLRREPRGGVGTDMVQSEISKDLSGVGQYLEEYLGIPSKQEYFNTGIMLIDMVRAREMGFFQALRDAQLRVKKTLFVDQDIFNSVISGHFATMPLKWNFVPAPRKLVRFAPQGLITEYRVVARKPSVLHYAGGFNKPWAGNGNREADHYWRMIF